MAKEWILDDRRVSENAGLYTNADNIIQKMSGYNADNIIQKMCVAIDGSALRNGSCETKSDEPHESSIAVEKRTRVWRVL